LILVKNSGRSGPFGSGPAPAGSVNAEPQGDEESAEKSNQVQLAAVENKAITEAATTFRIVVPQAGKIVSINLPFETVVRHVMVTRGQSLQPSDLLIQISASPAAQLPAAKAG
jgi:hypothetical protein